MVGYEVSKVIVMRITNSHIPYIKGILVKDQEDNKYLLDEFNSEIIVKHIIKDNLSLLAVFNFRISELLISFGKQSKKLIVIDQDIPLDLLSERYEAKLLSRKEGLEDTNRIYSDTDYSELRKFILDNNY